MFHKQTNMMRTLTKFLSALTILIIPFNLSYAQVAPGAGDVLITEIARYSSSHDYLELYNNTSNSITLANCKLILKFGGSTGYILDLSTEGSGDIIVPANGFLVLSDNITKTNFNATWGIDIDALGANFYQSPAGVVSTAYYYVLKSGGTANTDDGTLIDSTLNQISTPRRYYQAPIGSGNVLSGVSPSDFTPGTFNVADDLAEWNGIYFSGSWKGLTPSSGTGASNFLIHSSSLTVINDGAVMNNLQICPNSSVYNSTQNVTILNDLLMDESAAFRINSSGSLTVGNSTTITVTGLSNSNGYNVWSSPFSGSPNILATFGGANPCDIYAFEASTQSWKHDYPVPFSTTCNGASVTFNATNVIGGSEGTADGNFDMGRGYFAPGDASPQRTLSSTSNPNNGTLSVPIYGSSVAVAGGNDWNLLGNPYISGLSVNNFINQNSGLINAVYVYNGSTGAYETYTYGDGYNLAIGQGFFLDGNSTTDGVIGNITFQNSQRFYVYDSFRKANAGGVDTSTIYLSLVNGNISDQVRIFLDPDCSDGFDSKFDARKLMNDNNLNFATLIESDPIWGPEPYVFNGVKSLVDKESKVIELFVQTNETGNFEIQLDSLRDMPLGMSMILEDKANSSMTNIRTESYTFNSNVADTLENRFYLHLSFDASITSIDEMDSNKQISIYAQENDINVKVLTNNVDIQNIEVYDIVGKMVVSNKASGKTVIISTNELHPAIYIVKVTDSEGTIYTERVYIK